MSCPPFFGPSPVWVLETLRVLVEVCDGRSSGPVDPGGAARSWGSGDQTFYRWRLKYGALKEDEAQRLKALEQENSRLTRIVAEQALEISLMKDMQGETSRLPGASGLPAS